MREQLNTEKEEPNEIKEAPNTTEEKPFSFVGEVGSEEVMKALLSMSLASSTGQNGVTPYTHHGEAPRKSKLDDYVDSVELLGDKEGK